MPNLKLPDYLPAKPDFLMDAKREQSNPEVGNGDERPTNLAFYSPYIAEQTDSSKQPTWNGDRWTFDNDRLEVTTIDTSPQYSTFVSVAKIDDNTNTVGRIITANDANGNAAFELALDTRVSPTEPYVRLEWDDDSSILIGSNTDTFELPDDFIVIGATFDPDNGRIYTSVHDGSEFQSAELKYSNNAGKSLTGMDSWDIGYEAKFAVNFPGDISQVFISDSKMPDSKLDQYVSSLADKWNI
jgi:hypothetical protein